MTDLLKPLKAENETSTSTRISPTTSTQAECDIILDVEKDVPNTIFSGP